MDCFALHSVNMEVKSYQSSLWSQLVVGRNELRYTTEANVVLFVQMYLRDIANAMGIQFDLSLDYGIKSVAPNIFFRALFLFFLDYVTT